MPKYRNLDVYQINENLLLVLGNNPGIAMKKFSIWFHMVITGLAVCIFAGELSIARLICSGELNPEHI